MAFKALTVNTPPAQAAHILAEDDAAIYGGLLGQDCVLPLGQKLKATVISNNKVRIADGVVSVGGHIGRVISGDYEDMTIANGVSGKKRNDIIAARFIAGASGGADTYKLVVVQGAAGTAASDPVTVRGDLYSGDKQRDYPLWRVKIEGLSIVKVEQMYKVGVSDAELLERMTEMNRSLTEKITAINSSLLEKIHVHTAHIPSNPTNTASILVDTASWVPVGNVSIPPYSLGILIASGGKDAILIMLSPQLELFVCFRSGESWTGRKI